MALWTRVSAAIPALKARLVEFFTATYTDPRFNDDIMFEIYSYLDPPDAARAGRVCTQWNVHSARAAYSHIYLHSASPSALPLSRTLGTYPHLRTLVRHLTIVHCHSTEDSTESLMLALYGWLMELPAGALRTCRLMGNYVAILESTLSFAVLCAPDSQILTMWSATGRGLTKRIRVSRESCRAQHTVFPSQSDCIPQLLPAFDLDWGPASTCGIHLRVASPPTSPSSCLIQMRALVPSLSPHLARVDCVLLAVGYVSPGPLPVAMCGLGVLPSALDRLETFCMCTPFPDLASSPSPRLVAALVAGGMPFPTATVEALVDAASVHGPPGALWAELFAMRTPLDRTPHWRIAPRCGICRVSMSSMGTLV